MIKTYRKKPVDVQAVRLPLEEEGCCSCWSDSNCFCGSDGKNAPNSCECSPQNVVSWDEVIAFLDGHTFAGGMSQIYIHTLEGIMEAQSGDWLIRGVAGEVYPIKNDIFLQIYELVKE